MSNAADAFVIAQDHLKAGRLADAERVLLDLARSAPPYAPALHLLGVLAYQNGNVRDARDYFQAAVEAQPANADFRSCLGAAWQELGRFDLAEACQREALRIDPVNVLALSNLGITLVAQNRHAEAITYFTAARRRDVGDADAACNLAAALKATGAVDDALTLFQEALRLNPNLAQAHHNLGNLLEAKGESAAAEAHYQNALRLVPRLLHSYLSLGLLWQHSGRLEPAVRLYRQGLSFHGGSWELHAQLGRALLTLSRPHESLAACRQAVALRPNEAELHNDLGNALQALGHLDEALAAYEQARQLRPDWSAPHYNQGVTLQGQGRLSEAQACIRGALRLNPSDTVAHSTFVGSLHYDPKVDAATLLAEHRRWADRQAPSTGISAHRNSPDPNRRLRIGYVSPDFRNHAVAFFLEPILANHDPQQVETFAYAEVPAPDEKTAYLRTLVQHWRDTHGVADEQLAAAIRGDGIDVLVDLGGQLAGNRLLVFARKPAPVQVSYLGYPGTTGLPAVDYRIADGITDPPDEASWYTEELVRLEPPFCCFAPPPGLPQAETLPSVAQGVVTFGALHKLEKLNDAVLDLWCELLRDVRDARLLLCRNTLHGGTADELAARFAARGIGGERLLLRRVEAVHMGHLLAYNAIDVALDAFPWNGHTTACEALWMGVPVVTLRGKRCAGRMTASVLHALGLEEWVADSPTAYRQIARELARDVAGRDQLRRNLRGGMLASALCDGRSFTRKLEEAYRRLWRRWCARAAGATE